MPIDFPNSPNNGDSFTSNDKTWQYNGTSWVVIAGSVSIDAGSVTASKLASDAVTTAKIASDAVTTAKIASDAVTTAKILDANVTTAKIASNAVTEAKILDANITTAKIASNAVTTAKILDANVTEAKIESNAVTTGKLGTDVQLGYRNVVINGAMQVAQRGTSTAGITTTGYYTADRFNTLVASMGTWTQSVENDAPTGSGFRKSLKMLCTTADASPAAGDLVLARTTLEGQNLQQFLKGTASAKQFTMSFWVKSNVTGTYIADLEDDDNSRQVSASYTIAVANTWEKKTITFPADTTGAFTNDNGASLYVSWWLGAGTTYTSGTLNTTWAANTNANRAVGQTNLAAATNNYWQITGVQLEAGAVATPFEFENYGTTLQKCQRYYCRVYSAYLGTGLAYSTTSSIVNVFFPTTMRVAPSALETTGVAANYFQVISNTGTQICNAVPAHNNPSTDYCAVTAVSASTGLVQGNATFILAANGSVYFGFSAEL